MILTIAQACLTYVQCVHSWLLLCVVCNRAHTPTHTHKTARTSPSYILFFAVVLPRYRRLASDTVWTCDEEFDRLSLTKSIAGQRHECILVLPRTKFNKPSDCPSVFSAAFSLDIWNHSTQRNSIPRKQGTKKKEAHWFFLHYKIHCGTLYIRGLYQRNK